jgi:hypothetical protein
MRLLHFRIAIAVADAILIAAFANGQTNVPSSGYVPDSATAVHIAEAVLVPVYGKKVIEAERPFTAKLQKGVWTVSGTLHCPGGNRVGTTEVCIGGTAVVEISKTDGRILSMGHYK